MGVKDHQCDTTVDGEIEAFLAAFGYANLEALPSPGDLRKHDAIVLTGADV
jgi:hypothetical protein